MVRDEKRPAGRRLVDMSSPVPAWEPDLPGVETYEETFPISDEAAYTQRLDLDEYGRIVEWAVVQTRSVDGSTRRVAVYDTCHGKGVHVHLYDRDEREFAETVLRAVQSYADLENGLDFAVNRVVESWQDNERRSDRGQ